MKRQLMTLGFISLLLTGCHRTGRETWEDTKTCGRYVSRGLRSLLGQHDTFVPYAAAEEWSSDPEFIPLHRETCYQDSLEMSDYIPPAKDSPGDPNSPIPGIHAFTYPTGRLAELFSTIHFETDQYAVVGEKNAEILHEIATFLKQHPSTYIFVEGHADERGPAAYNLALGSRRANSVRAFLVQNGVNPDQLFTISYGKERPCALGHDQLAWQQNRRAQFKLYER